jgi:mycothiol synthase
MLTLTMRSYGGEKDNEAIAHLFNTCAAFDRVDRWISVNEVRLAFEMPSFDRTRDMRLWEDAEGNLIGIGGMRILESGAEIDGSFWFRIHPKVRGSELGKQIIAWGEQRMREVERQPGVRAKLVCGSRDDNRLRIALLESCRFTAERFLFDMEKSLLEPLSESQFPESFTLRNSKGEQDSEAWIEMRNQSFIDHWNYHVWTVERYRHFLTDPHYKPELDLIAVAPDGTFVAFCLCHINPEQNEQIGRKDGWIYSLGTRRGFRRIGLGRAMLLAGLHQLKAAGMETAKLGVDADNPNGALQLYESVGFRKIHSNISYFKYV